MGGKTTPAFGPQGYRWKKRAAPGQRTPPLRRARNVDCPDDLPQDTRHAAARFGQEVLS